jgi:hypothetical protein
MQGIHELATDFTAMLAAGRKRAAADKYWSPDISIVEPADRQDGSPVTAIGFPAAQQKLAQWLGHNTIEDVLIDGPFVTGDRFALFIDMEIVRGDTGTREPFSEIAMYTVRDGKIVEERHFYDRSDGEFRSKGGVA